MGCSSGWVCRFVARRAIGIDFVHDPDHHRRGLGNWSILCSIDEARRRGLPDWYLGYRVADCLIIGLQVVVPPFRNPRTGWRVHPL